MSIPIEPEKESGQPVESSSHLKYVLFALVSPPERQAESMHRTLFGLAIDIAFKLG